MKVFFTILPSRPSRATSLYTREAETSATSVAVGRTCKCRMFRWAFSPAGNNPYRAEQATGLPVILTGFRKPIKIRWLDATVFFIKSLLLWEKGDRASGG